MRSKIIQLICSWISNKMNLFKVWGNYLSQSFRLTNSVRVKLLLGGIHECREERRCPVPSSCSERVKHSAYVEPCRTRRRPTFRCSHSVPVSIWRRRSDHLASLGSAPKLPTLNNHHKFIDRLELMMIKWMITIKVNDTNGDKQNSEFLPSGWWKKKLSSISNQQNWNGSYAGRILQRETAVATLLQTSWNSLLWIRQEQNDHNSSVSHQTIAHWRVQQLACSTTSIISLSPKINQRFEFHFQEHRMTNIWAFLS